MENGIPVTAGVEATDAERWLDRRFAGGAAAFQRWAAAEAPDLALHPAEIRVQGPNGAPVDGYLEAVAEAPNDRLIFTVRMDREVCERSAVTARRTAALREILLADEGHDPCATANVDPFWILWPGTARFRLYTAAVAAPVTCAHTEQLSEALPRGKPGASYVAGDTVPPTEDARAWRAGWEFFKEGGRVVELRPLSELDGEG